MKNLTLKIDTHLGIDKNLCGTPELCENGKSRVSLKLRDEMAADEKGLVHGGFIFGLADYAAMLAVNHPNVVLASADTKFLKPSVKGETLVAEANIKPDANGNKNKIIVEVDVFSGENKVFTGEFLTIIPKKHVLD